MRFYTNVERQGNNILWRGFENGQKFARKVRFEPTLYLPAQEETKHKSLIGGLSLTPKKIHSMYDAKEFIDEYKDVSGFEIYGNSNFVAQFIQEKYPDTIKFDISLINILFFDIEVDISEGYPDMDTADKPLTSISMKSSKKDTYYVFGLADYDKNKTITGIEPANIMYFKCDTEETMIRKFMKAWKHDYPDVISGWNVEFFDVAYLFTRIKNLFGQDILNMMSPWGKIMEKSVMMYGREQKTYIISGIEIIDYMDTFKKFGYKYGTQETYKLDHIANVVLKVKKLSYEEYGSLTNLYNENPQLYLDYNLRDTQLIQEMEDETGLLSLALTVAYSGGVNYREAFGTVGIWDTTLYRKLMQDNIVPFIKKSPDKSDIDLIGGYVKEPQVGMHDWVISFDLNSLYPHLMMQYNMSPETIITGHRGETNIQDILDDKFQNSHGDEYSVAANGVRFTNKFRGVIPSIIEEKYAHRKSVRVEQLKLEQKELDMKKSGASKKELHDIKQAIVKAHNEQMAVKILMNALYGATANRYFIYFISDMAEAITTSGQLSLRWVEIVLNKYMNKILDTKDIDYVIYCDTDSVYMNMKPLMDKVFGDKKISRDEGEKFLDKVSKEKLEHVIENAYKDLARIMGAYDNRMVMKREKINDKALFVAKKKYVLNTVNSEGVHYDEPKISITGLEAIRSSTPEVCRGKLKESMKVMMNGTEEDLQEFFADFEKEFMKMTPDAIAKNSGTDSIEKFMENGSYRKGTPIHYRGCIVYNKALKAHKLDSKYETIRSGDKIKFVYLKIPNTVHENIVSFPAFLPEELGLHEFVDYNLQFEKVFVKPLSITLDAIGWKPRKVNDLGDFFG